LVQVSSTGAELHSNATAMVDLNVPLHSDDTSYCVRGLDGAKGLPGIEGSIAKVLVGVPADTCSSMQYKQVNIKSSNERDLTTLTLHW
jgi:hypothetical protein